MYFWKTIISQQFGATIDMLENAMQTCPEKLWFDRSRQPEFWYLVFHTLFWLDFYLSDSAEGFTPPSPFTLDEMDPAGLLPERPYTKEELQSYLEHDRQKCRKAIKTLTEKRARQRWIYGSRNFSVAEVFLYQIRHVQHHAAQLNLILRQKTDSAPPWVRQTKNI